MIAQIIAPVVPSTATTCRMTGPAATRRMLPLPQFAPERPPSILAGMATIDCNGRLAEATVIPALGWAPGTCLDIRICGGLVLINADTSAVFQMTRPGQVRLPATVRHWCGLTPGSRVLLAAEPAVGRLVVHPPAALHQMISEFQAAVLGGEAG